MAPALYFASPQFQKYVVSGKGAFLWLTSALLMILQNGEDDPGAWLLIAFSVLLNAVLYASVVSLFWFVLWFIRRVVTRTP